MLNEGLLLLPPEDGLSFLRAPDARAATLLKVFQMYRYSCLVVPQLLTLPGQMPLSQALTPLTWVATASSSRNPTSSLPCPALPAAQESMQSPKSS